MKRLALALLLAGCQVSLPLDDGTREVSDAPLTRLQVPAVVDLGAIPFFPGLFDESARSSSLWVRNTGTTAVTVSGVTVTSLGGASADELCVGDGCVVDSTTIQPGALWQVSFRLRPLDAGQRAFAVTFATDAGEQQTTVRATPVHETCHLAVSPGRVILTRAGAKQVVELRNLNHGPSGACLLTEASIEGEFEFAMGLPVPMLLRSGAVAVLAVAGDADNATGQLTIRADGNVSVTVPIESRFAAPEPPCLFFAPDDVDFGTVKNGCFEERTFSIYNTCSVEVTVAPRSAVPGFELNDASTITMPAGTSMQYRVRYAPTSYGASNGAIVINTRRAGETPVDYIVTLRGNADTSAHTVDTFRQDVAGKVDLLFVVDDSPSMAAHATKVATEIQRAFTGALECVDAQIGVVAGSQLNGALAGSPAIVHSLNNPNAASQTLTNVASLSYTGVEPQASLASTVAALTASSNAALFRPGVQRSVVLITDGDDASSIPVGELYATLPAQSAFTLIAPTDVSSCAPPLASTSRLDQAAAFFTGPRGLRIDVCSSHWFSTLGTSACGRATFFLTAKPVEATLDVTLDGAPATGWSFDALTNSIVFAAGSEPSPGTTLTVGYDVACR